MSIYTQYGRLTTQPSYSIKEIERKLQDITEKDIKDALEYPVNFGYHGGNEELFDTWSLGPVILHRDSKLLEESNAAALKDELEQSSHEMNPRSHGYTLGLFDREDYDFVSCNHWAVGWVEHLSFRAINEDGTPTAIFAFILLWEDMLESYPVANEEDYTNRQWKFAVESVRSSICSKTKDNIPEDWIEQILNKMDEYPDEYYGHDNEILSIAKELGFIEDED